MIVIGLIMFGTISFVIGYQFCKMRWAPQKLELAQMVSLLSGVMLGEISAEDARNKLDDINPNL